MPYLDDLEDDLDCRPCGCPHDYHMADCPILTDRFADADPPEPDEDDDMSSRWDECGGCSNRFCDTCGTGCD